MSAPAVSVVIATYQRAALVQEAIASVLDQTRRDFELVVVDDGSTDGTSEIVRRRFGGDPRVRVHTKANGGTASARNAGIDAAAAPVVAFLDSDDLWLPDYLDSQLAALDREPGVAMVLCDARYEGDWEYGADTVFGRRGFRAPLSLDDVCNGAWALPSCMVARTAVMRALRFDETYRVIEDTELLFRFFAAGHRVALNPAVLTRYRKHEGAGGAPQKMDAVDARIEETIRALDAHAHLAPNPAKLRYQLARKRSLHLVRHRRWREARPHLWTWWKAKPDSTKALRWWLRSLLAR
jgi:glycosyltransferase involved in cell wall biosynthesis